MNRFFCFIFLFISINVFSQKEELKWEVFHPIDSIWITVERPMSVQEVLFQRGDLPDPFVGENELLYTWVENYYWEYRSTFNVTEDHLSNEYLELDFQLVDTYASIYLNDSLLGQTNNFFRPYRFSIKKGTKLGANKLKVVFTSPINYHKERFENEKFHYPTPNDVGEIKIAPYTRKPQYQFGWDWSIRMNTIGLLKPVHLTFYNANLLINKSISTIDISDSLGLIEFVALFSNPIKDSFSWKSDYFSENQKFKIEGNKISTLVTVNHPKLWWPRGHGEAYLYSDKWIFNDESRELVIEDEINFGIRKTELIQKKDSVGTSYTITVNRKPIFCKGGNYIPQDVFPSRIKDEDIIELVKNLKESNFNMVRVWGGGYYPDDVFYEACDKAGIMVWQDLMFACSMYPGDSTFLNSVKGELEYQVPRISSHPSVVLFNGNNEVDVAWKNWGFQLKYGIFGKDADEVEKAYDDLFKKIAPSVIKSNSTIPYIHTSPLSNWGKHEGFNHGTMHYWGVWHGKDPIEDFGKKSGRFNSEYGFQSFPQLSTLKEFANEDDLEVDSEVMKHHQKSYVGNEMILKQTKRLYGEPKDFDEFVYFSQLTQAKALSIAISSHRTNYPTCMGTLFWQVNDCWQAPTWSSLDYNANWKLAQYQVQKDYQDETVLERVEELGKEKYYFISDAKNKDSLLVNLDVLDLEGNLLKSKDTLILPNESGVLLASYRKEGGVLQFSWHKLDSSSISTRSFSCLPEHHKKASRKSFNLEIEEVDSVSKTMEIKFTTSEFLKDVWFTSNKTGIHFEENGGDFLPGTYELFLDYKLEPINVDDVEIFWR